MRPGLGPDLRRQVQGQMLPDLNLQSREHALLLLVLRQKLIEVVEQYPPGAALLLALQLLPQVFMDPVECLLQAGMLAL